MKKQFLTCLFLLVFLGTQAQTKEETVAYINKLVSQAKPGPIIETDKEGIKWTTTITDQNFTQEEYSLNQTQKSEFKDPYGPGKKSNYEHMSFRYSSLNYKYLVDSFRAAVLDDVYTYLTIAFSKKVSETVNGSTNRKNSFFSIYIPTEKVTNVKKALLHLRELALKEKDLFD